MRQGAPAAARAAVVPELAGEDSRAVLQELAAELSRAVPGSSAAELARGLGEREALGSTALGGGVAIPHCRSRGIDSPQIVIGRHRAGVAFGAPDGAPVRLFVVIAAPVASPGAHLRLLARLARALRDCDRVERLLGAADEEGILSELFPAAEDEPA